MCDQGKQDEWEWVFHGFRCKDFFLSAACAWLVRKVVREGCQGGALVFNGVATRKPLCSRNPSHPGNHAQEGRCGCTHFYVLLKQSLYIFSFSWWCSGLQRKKEATGSPFCWTLASWRMWTSPSWLIRVHSTLSAPPTYHVRKSMKLSFSVSEREVFSSWHDSPKSSHISTGINFHCLSLATQADRNFTSYLWREMTANSKTLERWAPWTWVHRKCIPLPVD